MKKKLRALLNSSSFYAGLALCLLAVGVGGYALFSGGEQTDPAEDTPDVPVTAPVPEEVEPPAVEAAAPAEVETEPEESPVPVETADPAPEEALPVVAEIPRLAVDPLQGEVVTAFSVDELLYSPTLADWRTHDGVDIAAAAGTTVMAAMAGTVRTVTDDALMGTTVVIDHEGGYQTTYACLQAKPTVSRGDKVSAGQIIGAVGTTAAAESAEGPHLHFSVTKDGDVVDPEEFLNG